MANTTQDLHTHFEPQPNRQSLANNADDPRNESKDVDYQPHPENSLQISPEHQHIIDCITRLYSGSASEKDMQVYAEKAIYDDPLSYCDTRYKIAGQWYGLPMIFAKLESKGIEVVKDDEEEIVYK